MNINKDNSIKSKIKISCNKQGAKTFLVDSYFDIPYKLVHYGNSQRTNHLEVIQMCSSPGVMDGDSLDMEVICGENTEFKLFTQSFNKIHPMPKGKGAEQFFKFKLKSGAVFQFLPHPTIPYEKSIFYANNEITLEEDSHLIWGDIISGGRIYSGEKFLFKKYHTRTKIYRDSKLILFDNQLIEPEEQPIEDMLFFEGYTHQATLVIVSSFADEFKKELDEILLEQFTDVTYGFTSCAKNALMIRALGDSGEALYEWMNSLATMAWEFVKYKNKQNVNVEADSQVKQVLIEAKETKVKEPKAKPKTKTSTKKTSKTVSKEKNKTISSTSKKNKKDA
ncbi:urease accessory protein UreD [Riemerella anatipestifer]|uniref:urease accessory protein UreD n=1 Tax=Riemerella anatipestifer TaxID=34085 RepID=UPI0030BC0E81